MANGYRRGSIFGALLLISLGALFLYSNMNPEFNVWPLFAQYWPLLIIFWGLSKLVDYFILRGTPEAYYAARLRGGEIFGLIMLVLFGTAFTQAVRFAPDGPRITIDDGDWAFGSFWGEAYEFPAELKEEIELPATLSLRSRGDITVSTTEGKELRMVARKIVRAENEETALKIADRYQPVLEKITGGYELRWRRESGSDRAPRYHIELFVPAKLNLDLTTRRGDIEVKNLEGNLEVDINRGNLRINDLAGNLQVKVRRAGVEVNHVRGDVVVEGSGNEVYLRTISGSASLKGEFFGPIQFEAIQGQASFKSRRTNFSAARIDGEMTVDSGDMLVRNVPGEVVLETSRKEIEFDDVTGPVRIENKGGPVVLRYRKPPTQTIEVINSRGRIELILPSNSGFVIDVSNRRGEIDSDFTGPDLKFDKEKRRTKTLTGSYGRRRTNIQLRTSYGEIRIRKAE